MSIGYDTLGNITHYNFTDKGTTSYQYDTDNLLTAVSGGVSRSFSYDDRGNVTANGKNTFTYNQANRMAASNVADYTYDGHGRRVKTTSANGTVYSFYDKAGRLVYREKADGQDINYVFLCPPEIIFLHMNVLIRATKEQLARMIISGRKLAILRHRDIRLKRHFKLHLSQKRHR